MIHFPVVTRFPVLYGIAPQEHAGDTKTPAVGTTATIMLQDEQDLDTDEGFSDTIIEMTAAQTVSRVAQKSLWLAVSYQQAIFSITAHRALGKTPISLTLWELPPVTIQQSMQVYHWTDVIQSLYPPKDDTLQGINALVEGGISAQEAISVHKAYGTKH